MKVNTARSHERYRPGERLRMGMPHGYWMTTTFLAGTTTRGMVALFVLSGPIDCVAFETYVERVLVPELRPGDIVITDNLSNHKGPHAKALIEAARARLLFLPPYSSDFGSIENAFAKLKALLRRAAERTVDGLWSAISRIVDLLTSTKCRRSFTGCGYDPDSSGSALNAGTDQVDRLISNDCSWLASSVWTKLPRTEWRQFRLCSIPNAAMRAWAIEQRGGMPAARQRPTGLGGLY